MIDIQFIRENPELVAEKSKQKGYSVDIEKLLQLDGRRRQMLLEVEELRARRNALSEQSKGQKPSEEQITQGKQLKDQISELEAQLAPVEAQFTTLHKLVPNMPLDSVPIGESEAGNVEVYQRGQKPEFTFEPKTHWQIAETRGWIDKQRAAHVSGARFAYIKGDLVKLQLGLMQWIVDLLTNQDFIERIAGSISPSLSRTVFTPVLPPYMLRTELYDAMDRLEPRDDRYKIEGEELWLQGSAEHVLGSMHAGETIAEAHLPIRYLGYATSFRKEAGTYGKDTEGIIRMHQFDKLEMESIGPAAQGLEEHLFLVAIQEHIVSELGLHYRKLEKCTADIGKPNAKGVDLDVWMPGQGRFVETHTADYMTDYQSRRLQTKLRPADIGMPNELVHTNDATALALGRAMAAIIEQHQTEDGRCKIPAVLQGYMAGKEEL